LPRGGQSETARASIGIEKPRQMDAAFMLKGKKNREKANK
jgi:hypothetical protein